MTWSQSFFRDDGMEYDKTISEAQKLIRAKEYDKAGEMLAAMLTYYHADGHVYESDDRPGARAEKLLRSIAGKCSGNAKIGWDPGHGG